MKVITVPVCDSLNVEYSTSPDGAYSPFLRVRPSNGSMSIDDLISGVRRHLLCSPSWVRSHVPCEFHEWHWSARFWFRVLSVGGWGAYIYFPIEVSRSDFNSISSRAAAL